jgi:hypothetical protein
MKETLEENYLNQLIDKANKEFTLDRKLAKNVAIKYAKWQQERSYSEEDLREAFKQSRRAFIFQKDMPPVYESFEEWFNEFKEETI